MIKNCKIAVDGPAGSGKSTIAKIIAEKKGFLYIDTGAMYRAVTYNCLKNKIDIDNPIEVTNICKNSKIKLVKTENILKVFVNEKEVTKEIRTREVTNNVYKIAGNSEVREMLVHQQRQFSNDNTVIMDGRDIGTVVFPKADLKIYLDASVKERTKRRYDELVEKGEKIDFEKLMQEVIDRDNSDKNRKVGPLKIAEDAVVLDTSNMNIEEVVNKILNLIDEELNK